MPHVDHPFPDSKGVPDQGPAYYSLLHIRAAICSTPVCPALHFELLGHQKTPYGFISIQVPAGFPNLFLDFVLFAPRPGVATTLHAI